MKFKIGDYVNWHEEFDDGIPGRDSGDGIVVDTQRYMIHGVEPVITYKTYRTKHQDYSWFESRNLKLKGETNE